MQLNEDQMTWLNKLGRAAKSQEKKDKEDSQKALLLDKFAEQREKNFDTVLEGMKISVGREGKNGKFETDDVWREDLDPTKMFDVDDQRQGWRVTDKEGENIEGELTEKWAQGKELVQQPEFEKFTKSRNLLLEMTRDLHDAEIEEDVKGKKVKKPLFKDDELMSEVYDPLVRRGVPETFVGNDYSRTQKMVKGSFEEYKKRLDKEDLKGFVAENKDLGVAVFRMCISLPGNIMASKGATDLLASQQETTGTPNPVHVFQQNFGVIRNDPKEVGELGEWADNVQKAAQTWAFIQNVSDFGFDVIKESIESVQEMGESGKDDEDENEGEGKGGKEKKQDHSKLAPIVTQSVVTAMALNMAKGLGDLGSSGSTIFGGKAKRAAMNTLLSKKDVKPGDITNVIQLLLDAIEETLTQLQPDKPKPIDKKALSNALLAAKAAFNKLKPDDIVKSLKAGELTKVVEAFNGAATAAGDGLKNNLGGFVKRNSLSMKQKASDFVADSLKDETAQSTNPEDDKNHKKDKGHDPDWVDWKGKPVCLRCTSDTKDVDMFAGILEQKIIQLKKDDLYFKMAVNLGGMAFDVASNFLAPLAMGGGLLRMSKFIFAAVKRFIDFNNFCSSKKAMMNAASSYSPSVRRFRDDSFKQGMHYSINAACEGVKIVGAILQCTPAVIGGIIAAQAASGVEAVEAVLYEIAKRVQVAQAWKSYKVALNNPDNRRLALIAMRKNPTLAKYAIAWGAVVEEDPLVGDFMAYVGLNSDTIQGNARIDKVVEYLEARLPDDVTVVGRRYATNADWAPAKVSLTVDSWLDAKTRGEKQGGVVKVDSANVESALTKYQAAREAMEKAKKERLKAREAKTNAAITCLRHANTMMVSYFPKDKNGGLRQEDMWEVVGLFLSQVDIDMVALEKRLEDIKALAKKRPNPGKRKVVLKKKVVKKDK